MAVCGLVLACCTVYDLSALCNLFAGCVVSVAVSLSLLRLLLEGDISPSAAFAAIHLTPERVAAGQRAPISQYLKILP